jgi:site-specific DNA-methyltransferase (adenine-specific)
MTAPEPYFSDGQVSLFLGDCREVLPALGVAADLVLADPPFGETALSWDRWPDGWLDVAATVSRSLWCLGSMRMFLEHAGEFADAGWKFSQDVIWDKQRGSGFAADRFKRVHETATHWYQGHWSAVAHEVPRVNVDYRTRGNSGRGRTHHTGEIGNRTWTDDGTRLACSVIPVRSMWRRGAIHRTEKPVPLLEPLISYGCAPGGLVVAPFAGSGSDLEAARSLGRRAIGIERDEESCEKAARRLSRATFFGDGAA